MKKGILLFLLLTSINSSSQELMNFYLEPNEIPNSIIIHTKVYSSSISVFSNYEVNFTDNTIDLNLCYYKTNSSALTFDNQSFLVNLPVGFSNFTLNINLYGDVDGPPCSNINLVDFGSFNFTFPFDDTATTFVPDESFEDFLESKNFGDGIINNHLVKTTRIENFRRLFLDGTEPTISNLIEDITGIEDFISLKYFWCAGNLIPNIDLSNNLLLEDLRCGFNLHSTLDFTNNINLKVLLCGGFNLTDLNITNNPNLIFLDCAFSDLSNLNLENNILLETLYCSNNNLNNLDLSNNVNLIYLDCHDNNLVSLDISNSINLESINCNENQLTELDISNFPDLVRLYCWDNQISRLDASLNPHLEEFLCLFNNLSSLNIQNGNNEILSLFNVIINPNLNCIQVDDVDYANNQDWQKDLYAEYNEDCTLGIEDSVLSSQFTIHPNPIKDLLTIGNIANAKITSIKLYDLLGRLVMAEKGDVRQLDVSSLNSGLFILKIKTDEGVLTKKIIKE